MLFSPARIGPYELSHRVLMASLTRMRAEPGAIPGELMVEYYSQRASNGGLIVSEATIVAENGSGYLGSPGLFDDSQIAGWKRVTDAVHTKGGRIFLQLYHAGRQSNSQLQPGGAAPVAPSAILVISVMGNDKVAVRLAPSGTFGDMSDSNPQELFVYVSKELSKLRLAYLHLIEPRVVGNEDDHSKDQSQVAAKLLRRHYEGAIIAAGGFLADSAESIINAGDADLVAFGRYFVSNADLPERLRNGRSLNDYVRDSFFGGTDVGYTDYPYYEAENVEG